MRPHVEFFPRERSKFVLHYNVIIFSFNNKILVVREKNKNGDARVDYSR